MRPLQSLTLAAMIALLSTTCGPIPDIRQPDRINYRLHDTLMRGCAMRCFQPPSLLAFQRKMPQRRGRCHLETLCGVHEGPSDPQLREIVDGVPPEVRRQVVPELFAKGRRAGWAKEFHSTVPSGYHQGDSSSAMREGSDYFPSTNLACPGGLQRTDAHGEGHFRQTRVAATLVKAGSHRVFPLDVEEVRNSEGQDKHDGEVHAATRLILRLRRDHPPLPLILGGDARYGHAPCIAQWRERRLPHVLVCKPTSHVALDEWVEDRAR
jgi:hypothetical protein